MTGRYRDASALRRALEARLKQEATDTGTDLARRRRLVVFDRVAARLSADSAAGWILKGGTVLEFDLEDALDDLRPAQEHGSFRLRQVGADTTNCSKMVRPSRVRCSSTKRSRKLM